MSTKAVKTQGTVVQIGQGDARTVAAGSDVFDAFGEVMGVDGPGGSADVIDATHFGSAFKEKLAGIPDEGQMTLRANLVLDDAGQLSARQARADGELRNIRVLFNSDDEPNQMDFTAYVLNVNMSAQPNSKWDSTLTLEISGGITYGNQP